MALKATIDGVKIAGEDRYDLSGKWDFNLGAYQADAELTDTVDLPGTWTRIRRGLPTASGIPRDSAGTIPTQDRLFTSARYLFPLAGGKRDFSVHGEIP